MNIQLPPKIKTIDNFDDSYDGDLEGLANEISVFIAKMTREQNKICKAYSAEEIEAIYKDYQSPEVILGFLKCGYLAYAEDKGAIVALRMIIKENDKYIPRLFFVLPGYRNNIYISISLSRHIARKLNKLGVKSYEFPAMKFPETLKLYRSLPSIKEIGPSKDGLGIIFRKEIMWSKNISELTILSLKELSKQLIS
ncbi:hypothetical protein GF312_17760 [Candidatus Poribacteria bacterium]|nr:hypothetical protein [Candidatus Poribacteria bacterium]